MAGTGDVAKTSACPCHRQARYVAGYKKQAVTRCAAATLWRAYYYCGACEKGFCRRDARLGIGRGQCSVAARAPLSRFASYLPYRTAAAQMETICGIGLSASTVRREAQAVGRARERDWQDKAQQVRDSQAKAPARRPSSLHLSMDGVSIFVGGRWREVRCAVAYESGHDEAGHAQGVERASYYARSAPSGEFGPRVRTLAYLWGSGRGSRVGVVADGAQWIWQGAGKHFSQGVQILDFYHACEPLWLVARARFGEGSEASKAWMQRQKQRLLDDKVAPAIAEIQDWQPAKGAQQEVRRQVLAYLGAHAHRMLYGTLGEEGWHIGSAVMEAACKAVVQGRMKGVGMRWSEGGAEAMLHLRSAWCRRERTDFTEVARRSMALA